MSEHQFPKIFLKSREKMLSGRNIHHDTSKNLSYTNSNKNLNINITLPWYYCEDIVDTGDVIKITWDEFFGIGIQLFSIDSRENSWFASQRKIYGLCRPETRPFDVSIMRVPPIKHYIEFDKRKSRVRLIGKNTSPTGKGGWVNLDK